jgi:hypothetical protein
VKAGTARRTALGLLAFGLVVAGSGMVLTVVNRSDVAQNLFFVVIFVSMACIGALVASRRPDNAIGWLLLWTTLIIGTGFVTDE